MSDVKINAEAVQKKNIAQELKLLLTNAPYMVSLVLTVIFGYGFSIVHNSISIDDFTSEIYYPWQGEMIAQGRFTTVIVAHIFRMLDNVPYFCDILSVVLLALSVMLMSIFFKRASKGKITVGAQIIFSCVLVSFPLMNEIYVYGGGNVNVCLGYLLTSAALLVYYEWYSEKKKYALAVDFVILFFVVSLYESFAVVFLCGVISLFILNFYYNTEDADRGKFGRVLLKGLAAIGILGLACIIEYGVGEIVLRALDIERSVNAATDIMWFSEEQSAAETIVIMISEFILFFYAAPSLYMPYTVLLVFLAVCLVLMIASWIKNKNFTVAALFFSLFFMQFFLMLLSGKVPSGRTCQYYAYFVAFLSMLLFARLTGCVKNTKKIKHETLKRAISIGLSFAAFWLVFVQSYDLNRWLCLDVQRSEEEIAVARSICDDLSKNYDVENKPVVVIGKRDVSDSILSQCVVTNENPKIQKAAKFFYDIGIYQIYQNLTDLNNDRFKFVRSNLNSYLTWATNAFNEPNGEMMKLFSYLGYDFHSVDTIDEYRKFSTMSIIMPAYPSQGYIDEEEGVIIVNLGPYFSIEENLE